MGGGGGAHHGGTARQHTGVCLRLEWIQSVCIVYNLRNDVSSYEPGCVICGGRGSHGAARVDMRPAGRQHTGA